MAMTETYSSAAGAGAHDGTSECSISPIEIRGY